MFLSLLPPQYQWYIKQTIFLIMVGGAVALWEYQPKVLIGIMATAVALFVFKKRWEALIFLGGIGAVVGLFMIKPIFGLIGAFAFVVIHYALN